MIAAVGYCRFSSENQADGFSIEAQKNAINEFASRAGYQILRFYVDEAKSGTTTDGRVGFLDMLSDSKKHEFQAVIVHKLDRFARSRIDSAVSKQVLKDNGVKLISVLEQLDDSPESIILESVLEGMNEYYSKNLSRETKKGMRVAGTKGRILGSIPYGYKADEHNCFAINEQEAPILKDIFNMYAENIPIPLIVEQLREKGYKTREGNFFTATAIAAIIRNKNYKGDYHFGSAVYPDVIPIIVDAQIVNKAQARLEANKRPVTPKNGGAVYLLTGWLFCSCGAPMVGYKSIKKGRPYYYYRCKNKEPGAYIKKEEIEQAVLFALADFFENPKVLNDLVKSINEHIKAERKNTDTAQLQAKVKSLEKQEEKLLDLYLSGEVSRDLYTKKKEKLDLELSANREQLKTSAVLFKINDQIVRLAIEDYRDKIKSNLDDLNPRHVQTAIQSAVKEIRLTKTGFTITFAFEKTYVLAYNTSHAPAQQVIVATYRFPSEFSFSPVIYSGLSIATLS